MKKLIIIVSFIMSVTNIFADMPNAGYRNSKKVTKVSNIWIGSGPVYMM